MDSPPHLHATRSAYDALATQHLDQISTQVESKPFDRAMLAAFAELVRLAGGGPVVDVGCGAGAVTAHLATLGLSVQGLDLSPVMLAHARSAYPDISFDEGALGDLDVADGALAGIVSWYSIVHTPREALPAVLAELVRALGPGGFLLLAFQVGDEPVVRTADVDGRSVELTFYRHSVAGVTSALRAAGLTVQMQMTREADPGETSPQACVLAQKPDVLNRL